MVTTQITAAAARLHQESGGAYITARTLMPSQARHS